MAIREMVLTVNINIFVLYEKYSLVFQDWLCKAINCIYLYTFVANILWMLVEGLFLHNRIAVTVFHTEAPFKIFYFIGWGKYIYKNN